VSNAGITRDQLLMPDEAEDWDAAGRQLHRHPFCSRSDAADVEAARQADHRGRIPSSGEIEVRGQTNYAARRKRA
jgi:hypothetical protein